LNLLKDSGYVSAKEFGPAFKNADELGMILFSILKSTRIKK